MNITLINPPYPSGAPQSIFIPLGISYLAAVLEDEGHKVDVVDGQVLQNTRNELRSKLSELKPDVVGVTSSTLTHNPAREVTEIAKEVNPECLTIMGGPHVTVLDKQTLIENPSTDLVVRGEGEKTLLEIVDLASKSALEDLDKVEGVTFRKNGKIFQTPDRPFIQDIEELPYPAFKHFQLNKYKVFGKRYLPIITSRGCPFQCTFCLASQMCGIRFRARSPEDVVDELEWIRDVHNAEAFAFYDDTFTFDMQRTSRICKEMINRRIDLPWDCRTRVDRISKDLLKEMRRANCQLVHFGVESGSQKMLNRMKKGVTVEQNEEAIKQAKEAGILVGISVIVGYPGETKETLQQTVDFVKRTKADYVYVCVAIPYPGTELHNTLKGLEWEMSEEWNQYDEQTLVFKNPHLSSEKIRETRRKIYNHLFSPSYILRKSLNKGFYNRIMARTALNDFIWRIKSKLTSLTKN